MNQHLLLHNSILGLARIRPAFISIIFLLCTACSNSRIPVVQVAAHGETITALCNYFEAGKTIPEWKQLRKNKGIYRQLKAFHIQGVSWKHNYFPKDSTRRDSVLNFSRVTGFLAYHEFIYVSNNISEQSIRQYFLGDVVLKINDSTYYVRRPISLM